MKAYEVEKQLNDFLSKRSFWNARYLSEIKRLHNIAPHKYKNKVKQEICNKIAEKIAGSEYARSYKSFFSKGNFTPYSIFFKALFVPHMKKELSKAPFSFAVTECCSHGSPIPYSPELTASTLLHPASNQSSPIR